MEPGICECGCGGKTSVSPYTNAGKGYVKGRPRRFISGHNGAHRPFTPLDQRYTVEDRGHETPCWIWKMSLTRKGYGTMWDPERWKLVRAHRFYYEHYIGPIPDELQIDHLCRQRACVNPWHMEPVTQPVNQQRGANAKLTREQANEIRRRGSIPRRVGKRQDGESYKSLAREFGVSDSTVRVIVLGRGWPHVDLA